MPFTLLAALKGCPRQGFDFPFFFSMLNPKVRPRGSIFFARQACNIANTNNRPYDKTRRHTSDSGKEHLNAFCKRGFQVFEEDESSDQRDN